MPTPVKWGSEFLVNTTTADSQSDVAMTALADGRFIVTWTDESAGDFDIRAQIFNADGSKSGNEFIAYTNATDQKVGSAVTALENGGFVIAWQDNTTFGTRAQAFDVNGDRVGTQISIDNATLPAITALANGNFVIAWEDTAAGDIMARTYDAGGNASGAAFPVNTTTANVQVSPTIASLTNGGFVVAWQDASQTGGDTDQGAIRAQILDAAGNAIGGELLVNTTTAGDQSFPATAGLADGRFIVAWVDESGTNLDVRAQIFNADGSKSGD
jgi:hypothetical protein